MNTPDKNTAPSSLRWLRVGLWGTVLVAGIGATWLVWGPQPTPPIVQTVDANQDIGQGTYQLQASDGTAFTAEGLKGQPSLVFFGFTHCPDVCPTTMADIASWQEALGDKAEALQVYLITVDPERDTPEIMGDYVSWMDGALGVSGSAEEMAKALSAFKVYARKMPLADDGYTMDHSAYIMLFDQNGRFSQVIAYQEPLERVLPRLERFLSENS